MDKNLKPLLDTKYVPLNQAAPKSQIAESSLNNKRDQSRSTNAEKLAFFDVEKAPVVTENEKLLASLRENNSKFPKDFDAEEIDHEGLKSFVKLTEDIHFHTTKRDMKNLSDKIVWCKVEYPRVRHIYGVDLKNFNKSAPYVALKNGCFDTYQLLVDNNITLAPDEDIHELLYKFIHENQQIKELTESDECAPYNDTVPCLFQRTYVTSTSPIESLKERYQIARDALSHISNIDVIAEVLPFILKINKFELHLDFEAKYLVSSKNEAADRMFVAANFLLTDDPNKPKRVYREIIQKIINHASDALDWPEMKTRISEAYGERFKLEDIIEQKRIQYKKISSNIYTLIPLSGLKECKKRPFDWMKAQELYDLYNQDEKPLISNKNDRDKDLKTIAVENDRSDVIDQLSDSAKSKEDRYIKVALVNESFESVEAKRTGKKTLAGRMEKLTIVLIATFLLLLASGITLSLCFLLTKSSSSQALNREECGRVNVKQPDGLISKSSDSLSSYSGEWPWHVPVFAYLTEVQKNVLKESKREKFICSSTIISQRHLLSAAHCYAGVDSSTFFALPGRFNLSNPDEVHFVKRNISQIKIHADYDDTRSNYRSTGDIAVLTMAQNVEFTDYIQPICLPQPDVNVAEIDGFIAGYGRRGDEIEKLSEVPRHAEQSTISNYDCIFLNKNYADIVSKKSFCAKGIDAVACGGDSGSGFIKIDAERQNFMIVGIVSQSLNPITCTIDEYVAFVNVVEYREWIIESVY